MNALHLLVNSWEKCRVYEGVMEAYSKTRNNTYRDGLFYLTINYRRIKAIYFMNPITDYFQEEIEEVRVIQILNLLGYICHCFHYTMLPRQSGRYRPGTLKDSLFKKFVVNDG